MIDKCGTLVWLQSSTWRLHIQRLHWRKDPADKKMKIWKGKTRYHIIRFLHELLSFFISTFLLFPLHVNRIILCFVYSDDHQYPFVYPSLKEEGLQPVCVVDVDYISSPQSIYEYDVCVGLQFWLCFAYIISKRPPFPYPVPPLLALLWHIWHLFTTKWGYSRYSYVSSYFYVFWYFKLILKLMWHELGTISIWNRICQYQVPARTPWRYQWSC
jgi:hypothetical protein